MQSQSSDELTPIENNIPPSPKENFNEREFQKNNKFKVDFKPKGNHSQEESAGKVPLNYRDQIVGGSKAKKGQFPWQVLITIDKRYTCGGSLIDPLWVLTAAHCCYSFNTFMASVGLVNRTVNESSRVDVDVQSVNIHPNYDSDFLTADICLLKLQKALNTSGPFVTTVRLPKISDATKSLVKVTGTISGWGKTSDENGPSDVLKYVSRTVIDNKECAKNYGDITVNGNLLCINNKDKQGTCQGDSGGPFVRTEPDNKFTQIGLVSFGSSVSCVTYPSGFTRVSAYIGWISTVTGLKMRN
ncbi:brachyurin-like [Cloeon dipterum]|uniref:brachyurin-like n=1 Tax=Cloeon dipterum TaxID=197152 RepID=UPI0032204CD7